jgi:hypothetical protein
MEQHLNFIFFPSFLPFSFFSFLFFYGYGDQTQGLALIGKHSTTKPHSQTFIGYLNLDAVDVP